MEKDHCGSPKQSGEPKYMLNICHRLASNREHAASVTAVVSCSVEQVPWWSLLPAAHHLYQSWNRKGRLLTENWANRKRSRVLVWAMKTKLHLMSKAIPLFLSTNFTIGTRAFAITCRKRKTVVHWLNKQLSNSWQSGNVQCSRWWHLVTAGGGRQIRFEVSRGWFMLWNWQFGASSRLAIQPSGVWW
jgi:hypothetical protein